MITEFGGSNGTECASYITDMVNYMAANDVYIGWTAWAAGPFWGTNSPCCTDSAKWGSLEPGSLAADGSPGLYTTVWLKLIQPLLPTTLVRSGISSLNPGGSVVVSSSVVSTSTTTASSSLSTAKSSTTTSSAAATGTGTAAHYAQCGGIGYSGPTVCASPYTCTYSNAYYSQCL
jgi:endoglucanase